MTAELLSQFNNRKRVVGKPRRTLIWGNFTLETTSSGHTTRNSTHVSFASFLGNDDVSSKNDGQ